MRKMTQTNASKVGGLYPHIRMMGWAAIRIIFILFSGLSVTTGVGCYILSPLFCYWFFGNFRFWKYLHLTLPMIRFTYHLAYLCLKGRSVTRIHWVAPPVSEPDLGVVKINPEWTNGYSCEDCGECCRKINCPFLDKTNSYCLSYNSFYWRYFNCGRYPTSQTEIDLYECPKWLMRT